MRIVIFFSRSNGSSQSILMLHSIKACLSPTELTYKWIPKLKTRSTCFGLWKSSSIHQHHHIFSTTVNSSERAVLRKRESTLQRTVRLKIFKEALLLVVIEVGNRPYTLDRSIENPKLCHSSTVLSNGAVNLSP